MFNDFFKLPPLIAILSTIFITLVGLYATTTVEELRTGRTMIYSINPVKEDGSANAFDIKLENISRTMMIKDARFVIKCRDTEDTAKNACFVIKCRDTEDTAKNACSDRTKPFQSISYRPNYTNAYVNNPDEMPDARKPDPKLMRFCISVIALSNAGVRFYGAPGTTKDSFDILYNPWENACPEDSEPEDPNDQNILLLEPSNIHAILAKYYIYIVLILAVVAFLALASAIVHWLISTLGKNERKRDENPDDYMFVILGRNNGSSDAGKSAK